MPYTGFSRTRTRFMGEGKDSLWRRCVWRARLFLQKLRTQGNQMMSGRSESGSSDQEIGTHPERSDEALEPGESGHDESTSDEADSASQEDNPLSGFETELAEMRDRHLRLAAEFENYRKRTREELGQSGTRAQAALIGSLLDVLDDFDRLVGIDTDGVSAESVLEGVQLVERKLKRALADSGVETLEPHGEPFDPEVMEAVMRESAESEEEDDTVSRVLQKGVIFKGHLVRPARVSVLKLDG
ncbi:MAG: nucleotide exchange factor GrpE [Gemmatimonadales bacterium]|nr:MAG: nucleotide exchange factor GrpE [Gemmatimonadales bacterium]